MSIFLVLSSVLAENEKPDIQAYLPLFERNSIEQKILEVSHSLNYEQNYSEKASSVKKDVHFVFDTETGNYREEVTVYDKPNDADAYSLFVNIWNGEKFVKLLRNVSKKPGSRALGSGVYESSGHAVIMNQPMKITPCYVSCFYDTDSHLFTKTVPQQNPRLGYFSADTITIETTWNKFVFSKKTGALKRIDYYNSEMIAWKTYELSNHVECSGIWIPLRIIESYPKLDGKLWYKREMSVDPKTLRLLDTVDDSLFNETLQAGCIVNDDIGKNVYKVTTVDTLPDDVEAVKKALEEMLKQAQEQKAAVEQKK